MTLGAHAYTNDKKGDQDPLFGKTGDQDPFIKGGEEQGSDAPPPPRRARIPNPSPVTHTLLARQSRPGRRCARNHRQPCARARCQNTVGQIDSN